MTNLINKELLTNQWLTEFQEKTGKGVNIDQEFWCHTNEKSITSYFCIHFVVTKSTYKFQSFEELQSHIEKKLILFRRLNYPAIKTYGFNLTELPIEFSNITLKNGDYFNTNAKITVFINKDDYGCDEFEDLALKLDLTNPLHNAFYNELHDYFKNNKHLVFSQLYKRIPYIYIE